MVTSKEQSVGVIGLGYWGKNVFRNMYEMGVVRTACDLDANTVLRFEKDFPGINYTSNMDEIFGDRGIKAVALATPASTHYNLAKKAILSGKDVFVEKPLALNSREGEELRKLADEKGRIIMVGHILYYHPAVVKLKELIASGSLGRIQYIYSNRLNIGKLR
ncbi:MAG: Gfo/Idh/MocA family oxidoreductase, partial [Candidatus Omnitrophota bacterium]